MNINKFNYKKRCDECKHFEGDLVGFCKKFKIDIMRFNTCDFHEEHIQNEEVQTNE